MNALDSLRRTLEDRAGDVVDHDLVARAGSVRRRVTIVRRRRRAAAASGLVAVLAVAAGVALVPRGGDRAGPADRVVGVEAPAELHSLGYTYDFADSVNGHDGRAVLRLDASQEPRLVSWATSGPDDAVTIDAPTTNGATLFTDPDFADWVYIPAGDAYVVHATATRGEPGLAVYTLGGERPPGITQDGVTFRQDISGGHLLGAAIGTAGQSEVTVPATATGPGIALKYYCSGGPADAYLHIDYTGDKGGFVTGQGCADDLPVDPASLGGVGAPTTPGDDVGMHYYVTRGRRGPVIVDPQLRLGIGIYATDTDPLSAEASIPPSYEDGGHTWRRVDVQRSAPGARRLAATAPDGRGSELAIVYANVHDVDLSADVDGHDSGAHMAGGGGALQGLVDGGGTVTVRVDSGRLRPGDGYGVAFYVRTD